MPIQGHYSNHFFIGQFLDCLPQFAQLILTHSSSGSMGCSALEPVQPMAVYPTQTFTREHRQSTEEKLALAQRKPIRSSLTATWGPPCQVPVTCKPPFFVQHSLLLAPSHDSEQTRPCSEAVLTLAIRSRTRFGWRAMLWRCAWAEGGRSLMAGCPGGTRPAGCWSDGNIEIGRSQSIVVMEHRGV